MFLGKIGIAGNKSLWLLRVENAEKGMVDLSVSYREEEHGKIREMLLLGSEEVDCGIGSNKCGGEE